MVQMSIDLGDIGKAPVTSGRALSLSSPVVRGSATSASRVIGTAPRAIAVTNGLATVEVEPGPILVQFHVGGVGDSKARKAVVPNRACTLREVLENGFTYEPEVLSEARASASAAQSAAQRAEDAAANAEAGGGGLTVDQIATAAGGQTPLKTAIDARAKAVGDAAYAPIGSVGGVGLSKNPDTGLYTISSGSSLTKNPSTGMYPIGV